MAFPVGEEAIERAEKQLGRPLPQALRARLMRENGGEAFSEGDDWQLHPVLDDRDRKRISRTANHLVRETELARREWPRFPSDAVAVAENGSGDIVILLPGSDDFIRWLHEDGTTAPIDLDLGQR